MKRDKVAIALIVLFSLGLVLLWWIIYQGMK